MAWHKFVVGHKYSLDEVVDVCERYVLSGGPNNPGEKLRHLDLIRNSGQAEVGF
jgi:hypothetical protein